jgi:uncharacterized membrane protein YozB (DUF420 family)
MLSGPVIILTLKVLVSLVSVIFAAALICLALGKIRRHGQLNTLFFILTMTTVLIFELLVRFGTDISTTFSEEAKQALYVHLMFSIPATICLPLMMVTGLKHWRRGHITLGIVFTLLWIGTVVTGLMLPTK